MAGWEVAGDGSLSGGTQTLSTVFDEVLSAAVAGNADYLVAWAGIPDTSNSFTTPTADIYSRLARKTTQLQTTVIEYDYNPLYQLVEATYSDQGFSVVLKINEVVQQSSHRIRAGPKQDSQSLTFVTGQQRNY